ncbi:MAG: hypothetical protein M3Y43_04065, partial [Pseudomonadota bacterium]|nr:hypothetical protein [Pseudomonadota bacterium]
ARKTVEDNIEKMKSQNVTIVEVSPEFKDYLRESAASAVAAWQETFGPQSKLILDLAMAPAN